MEEITSLLHNFDITQEKAAERIMSVFAVIALARTKGFRDKLCKKGERFLGLTA